MTRTSNILDEIFQHSAEERLSLEDERAAIAAAQAGDVAAQERLLLAYAPALRAGVSWHRRAGGASTGVDVEDVRQAAVWALLEAIHDFDLDGAYDRLAAVVHGRVHWAVSDAMGAAQTVSIPERTRRRFFAVLRTAGGDLELAERIAPDHDMSPETFRAVADAVASTSDDAYETLAEIPDLTEYEAAENRVLVEVAFSAVTQWEGNVCRLAYGFATYEPLPDLEIAHRLGSSRSAIQRTRTSALSKMRARLLPSVD